MKIYTEELLSADTEAEFQDIKKKYDRSCHIKYTCGKCHNVMVGKLRYCTEFPLICGACKSLITRIAKYGPSGISKEGKKRLSDIQKSNVKTRMSKTSSTKLARYGDVNYNNPEKAIKTKLELYGNLYDREKHIATFRKKYGVDFYTQTDEFKEKVRNSISKFGVLWPSQLAISTENSKKTCIKKYGVPFVGQVPEIREKIVKTCIDKYGVPFAPSHFAPARSILENKVLEFLDTLSVKYVTNNRTLLHGKEIDIYFPELKKAIEVQGTYWHADPRIYEATYYNKAKNMYASDIWEYDAKKAESINKLGITIFYLWEIDWNSNNDTVKTELKEFLQNG